MAFLFRRKRFFKRRLETFKLFRIVLVAFLHIAERHFASVKLVPALCQITLQFIASFHEYVIMTFQRHICFYEYRYIDLPKVVRLNTFQATKRTLQIRYVAYEPGSDVVLRPDSRFCLFAVS
jgi:hypothetical protein